MSKSLGDYRPIVVEREGKPTLRGMMWVDRGLVTVTSEDGRQKTTQVGGSPAESIAAIADRGSALIDLIASSTPSNYRGQKNFEALVRRKLRCVRPNGFRG